MNIPAQLFLFGLLAAGGTLIGGWALTILPVAHDPHAYRNRLRTMVALGTGFMLAVVFLELLPEIAGQTQLPFRIALAWLLGGYLLIQLIEHTIAPHFHFGEETHRETMQQHGVALTAIIALSLHAFFDGVAIASGVLTNPKLGLALFLAVLLHKAPEGFTVASIVLSADRGIRAARQASVILGFATLAGILLIALFHPILPYTLPLSAGVTLYVAASDLIPELNRQPGWRNFLMLSLGIALYALVHLALDHSL